MLEQPANTHPCLKLTSIKLIGDLYMWISHHQDNWLEKSIQYLLNSLTETGTCQKEFQQRSAKSLEAICKSCSKQLANHYNSLLLATDDILDRLIWTAAHNLLKGISYVISEGKTLIRYLYEIGRVR